MARPSRTQHSYRVDVYVHDGETHGNHEDLGEILRALYSLIERQGECIMSQLDDVKALVAAQSAQVDAIGVEVGVVAAEVAALIAKIDAPGETDLSEVSAGLASVNARLEAVATALKAIPTPDDAPAEPPVEEPPVEFRRGR